MRDNAPSHNYKRGTQIYVAHVVDVDDVLDLRRPERHGDGVRARCANSWPAALSCGGARINVADIA